MAAASGTRKCVSLLSLELLDIIRSLEIILAPVLINSITSCLFATHYGVMMIQVFVNCSDCAIHISNLNQPKYF